MPFYSLRFKVTQTLLIYSSCCYNKYLYFTKTNIQPKAPWIVMYKIQNQEKVKLT